MVMMARQDPTLLLRLEVSSATPNMVRQDILLDTVKLYTVAQGPPGGAGGGRGGGAAVGDSSMS